jgi:hypothetical protein
VPSQLLHLARKQQGRPSGPLDWHSDRGSGTGLDDDEFRDTMTREGCLIYDFEVSRAYGNRG